MFFCYVIQGWNLAPFSGGGDENVERAEALAFAWEYLSDQFHAFADREANIDNPTIELRPTQGSIQRMLDSLGAFGDKSGSEVFYQAFMRHQGDSLFETRSRPVRSGDISSLAKKLGIRYDGAKIAECFKKCGDFRIPSTMKQFPSLGSRFSPGE